MLIPLGTNRPLKRPSVVTPALIAANVAVFVAMAALDRFDPDLRNAIMPNLWVVGGPGFRFWSLITSAFLHAGLMHIGGNMLFLWVFGPSVEDRFGRGGFLALYLLAACFSGGLHALFARAPAVGASGAIAGVTGSFLVLFPRTGVRCIFFIVLRMVVVPAWWFIGFAIAWDFLSQATGRSNGVANLAHLGGYAFGFITSMTLLWVKVFPREPYDLFTMFRQAHRRRQFRAAGAMGSTASSKPALAVKKNDHRSDELAVARAQVSHLVAGGDLPAAGEAYQRLIADYSGGKHGSSGALTLARDAQYALANHFVQAGEHGAGADAYERFISAYPGDREIDAIRVMFGRLLGRYLGQTELARRVLQKTLDSKANKDIKQIAQEELDALDAEESAPAKEPK